MYQLALVAAGVPAELVDKLGEQVEIKGKMQLVNPEFLGQILAEDTLSRAFLNPQYKNHPTYKAGEAEMGKKAFADQIKELGGRLAGEGSEFAKELGKRYKDAGVFTPKALSEYAYELYNAAVSPLTDKLSQVDKGAAEFLSNISKLQLKNTEQEKMVADYSAQIKKLQEEDLPNTRKEVDAAKEEMATQTDLFQRFLMVPSGHDSNSKDGFEMKRYHITNVLLPMFRSRVRVEANGDGRGGKKFYLDGSASPFFVNGNVHGELADVINFLVRQPQALGYFKASEGGAAGSPANQGGEGPQKVSRKNYFG